MVAVVWVRSRCACQNICGTRNRPSVARTAKDAFFTSMDMMYFLSGIASGQAGYVGAASMAVQQDKMHFLMSPEGGYGRACLPQWRLDMIAKKANFSNAAAPAGPPQ